MHQPRNNLDETGMDKKLIISLKKASSNIRRTLLMLEERRPIIDLLQMNAATLGLLRNGQRALIRSCIEEKLKEVARKGKKQLSKELLEEIIRMVKSYDQ